MASKYKISLYFIGICLIFSLFLLASFVKFKKEEKERSPLVIVNNGLSINFLQGKNIKIANNTKKYTFSITNNTEEKKFYHISLENIKCNQENITYDLKEKNNKLNITKNSFSEENKYLANFIEIKARETHFYELTIYEKEKLNLNAEITIGMQESQEDYFANTILKNNEIKKLPLTKVGEEIAATNEGLIETKDDYGISYYFRGNIPNNYVLFANLLWRIVKINGDGTIKLVLNDYIETPSNFYNGEEKLSLEEKLNFTKTNINKSLEDWYQLKLKDYETYLISHKYCVTDTILNEFEQTKEYVGKNNLKNSSKLELKCSSLGYPARIGLLSAEEIAFAGGSLNEINTNYYLYTPEKETGWWTITPSSSDATNVIYFEVNTSGKLQEESLGSYYRGLKPVINLIKKTSVTGNGTNIDPYIIKE